MKKEMEKEEMEKEEMEKEEMEKEEMRRRDGESEFVALSTIPLALITIPRPCERTRVTIHYSASVSVFLSPHLSPNYSRNYRSEASSFNTSPCQRFLASCSILEKRSVA